MSKQEIFYIPQEDVPEEFLEDINESEEYLTFVTNWIKEKNIHPKRGDAILIFNVSILPVL